MRQDVELVRLMSAKGADLTVRDRSGSTALMWAAFNEAGDAGMVEELLRRGANPDAVNNTGETALTWALRRGETPAVAALRRAGASDTLREKAAVQKALALLQRSGAQFRQVSGCQSCHHNALPQMAIGIARSRGLAIDEPAARQDVEATVAMLRSVPPKRWPIATASPIRRSASAMPCWAWRPKAIRPTRSPGRWHKWWRRGRATTAGFTPCRP